MGRRNGEGLRQQMRRRAVSQASAALAVVTHACTQRSACAASPHPACSLPCASCPTPPPPTCVQERVLEVHGLQAAVHAPVVCSSWVAIPTHRGGWVGGWWVAVGGWVMGGGGGWGGVGGCGWVCGVGWGGVGGVASEFRAGKDAACEHRRPRLPRPKAPSAPQQDVVQPGGQHQRVLLPHQVADGLQHRLEVVLLGL